MRTKRTVRLCRGIAAGGALLLAAVVFHAQPSVEAQPQYLTAFGTAYPQAVGTKLYNCTLCHRTETERNPFGVAFAEAGHDFSNASFLNTDSDGDGWTNAQEIKALSFPGDPADRPAVGEIRSTARVIADELDPDPTDNVATAVTVVANTVPGLTISVLPPDAGTGTSPVTVTFAAVTRAGTTTLTSGGSGPPPPPGFAAGRPPVFYELATTAAFSPPVTVCIRFAGTAFGDASHVRLFHVEEGAWADRTVSVDPAAEVTCGSVMSFSPFAVFELTDFTPPVLTLPGDQVLEATGPAGAVATFTATAIDAIDGPRPVTCAPASGSVFALGTTTVVCTASDTRRNTATGAFTITVRDTTPPTLSLPGSLVFEATSPAGAVATFDATAVDIVDGALPVTCMPPSGATFALGTTTVTCSSSDRRGNTATGGFTVLVHDTTPPGAACTPVVSRGGKDDDDDDAGAGRVYRVTGSDAVGPLRLAIGPYILGNGAVIKLAVTRRPGVVEVGKPTRSGLRRFRVGAADAFILARDGAGNSTKALCPVGRDRDGDDDHERHDRR